MNLAPNEDVFMYSMLTSCRVFFWIEESTSEFLFYFKYIIHSMRDDAPIRTSGLQKPYNCHQVSTWVVYFIEVITSILAFLPPLNTPLKVENAHHSHIDSFLSDPDLIRHLILLPFRLFIHNCLSRNQN